MHGICLILEKDLFQNQGLLPWQGPLNKMNGQIGSVVLLTGAHAEWKVERKIKNDEQFMFPTFDELICNNDVFAFQVAKQVWLL